MAIEMKREKNRSLWLERDLGCHSREHFFAAGLLDQRIMNTGVPETDSCPVGFCVGPHADAWRFSWEAWPWDCFTTSLQFHQMHRDGRVLIADDQPDVLEAL